MNKGLPKVLVGAFMLCGCVNAANAETVIIRQAPIQVQWSLAIRPIKVPNQS